MTRHLSVQQQIQSRIVTPLWPCLLHNEAFVSLILMPVPAVLVQDRFVSTVYCGYTIIVSHVLVTLSVFSWIGDEQNLWFVSSLAEGTLVMTLTTRFVSSRSIQLDTGHSHSHLVFGNFNIWKSLNKLQWNFMKFHSCRFKSEDSTIKWMVVQRSEDSFSLTF